MQVGKNQPLSFNEYLFFLPLLTSLLYFVFLDSYDFSNLKKFMILFSLSLTVLIFNKREIINIKFEEILNSLNSKSYLFSFILLAETILAKSGTYGLIFFSNSFISQNIFDFKPQRIFLAVAFTFLFFNRNLNKLANLTLLINCALLITYSRIVFVMFFLALVVYFFFYKDLRKIVTIFGIVFFLTFSGLVDLFGLFLNNNLVDKDGKEFISIVCAEHLDDGVFIYPEELKNLYLSRNVDYGEYPTLPRYFTTSNILETLEISNVPKFLESGKDNICNNYDDYLFIQNINIESCEFDLDGLCKVNEKNPLLFSSQAQTAQLSGNLAFRFDLWNKVIDEVRKDNNNLFFGIGLNENLPELVDTERSYGNLWHAHSSIFSLLGFYGIIGLFLFLYIYSFIFFSRNKFNFDFLILFFCISILLITDAVLETPDLSIIFAFFAGLINKN
tara:strand:- start:27881 stop:29215 length:1335 start_codon:yes stop_codon:yes gene_type:complete